MGKLYEIVEAHSEQGTSYAIAEFTSKVNRFAAQGYKLKTKSVSLFREDKGNTCLPVHYVIGTMVKKDYEDW